MKGGNMVGMEKNHCRIVSHSLNQPVDELNDQTIIALNTLQDRLDYLKRKSPLFANVTFSPQVKALLAQMETAVVG
jgi:hypothetical protein